MNSSIDQVLHDAVATGAVPNVAAIAADANGVIYQGAAGPIEVGSETPVTVDTQFRIMSMTKMVATTSALQLVESGQLDLDAPVEQYLPEFGQLQVLIGLDGGTPKLRPPASPATVKQLVTHTSGLGYAFFSTDISAWEQATGNPPLISGLNKALEVPLLFDPGIGYAYGPSVDWLGKVVEAVGGKSLDVAIKEGITGPLGMDNTAFLMNETQRANSTPLHIRSADKSWTAIGEILNQEPEWWAGGHGLYSTPSDYIRFERALLRGGELDGERILSKRMVDAAFTNQIGDLDFPATVPTADPATSCDFNAGPGYKWGLGLLLNSKDQPGMRRAWSGAWAGLFNTHFWVDRSSGICASIYSNILPFATPEALQLYVDFERELYATLA